MQAYKIRDRDGRSAIDHRSSHVLAPVKHQSECVWMRVYVCVCFRTERRHYDLFY